MSISFLFLLLLIAIAPLSPTLEGPLLHGLVGVIAAGALGMVAYTAPYRVSELKLLHRPLVLIAVMCGPLAAWMLLQMLPLGALGLTSPIWESTQAALGRPMSGMITIDYGATLVAFGRYLTACAILLVAACEAVERQNSALILFALTGAATLLAIDILLEQIAGLSFLRSLGDRSAAAAVGAGASLGAIVAAVGTIRFANRHRRRAVKPDAARQQALGLILSLIAFALCAAAILTRNVWQEALAVLCGLAILAVVLVGRRFHFAPWQCIGMSTVLVILAIAVAASRNERAVYDPMGALASAPPVQIATAERMIRESVWFGSGAGTYDAVLPMYRVPDDVGDATAAPTSAVASAVELGQPALGIIVLMAVSLIAWLMRAALLRIRDSSYPSAAAASLVVLTIQSFSNASLFATSIQIFATVLVGLGLAQSERRSGNT